jgi:hypothetical protein
MRRFGPLRSRGSDRARRTGRVARAVACAVAAPALLHASAAAGLPRGQARTWVEESYARWGPYGIARAWDGPTAHWEAELHPENHGTWNVWLEMAARHQEGYVRARGIPTTMGRLSVEAGDLDITGHEDDPLRREFQPTIWYRGASVAVRDGARTLEVRGGALTRSQSFWGGGRTPGGADVLGVAYGRTRSPLGPWRASMDAQLAKEPNEVGRHVARLFVGERPREGWARLGEVRVSRQDAARGWGTSLVAGTEFVGARYTIGGHVRRISPGFRDVGLTPDPHTNEWGGRFEWSARPRPRFQVGSSIDWARELSTGLSGLPREERLFGRFFLGTALPANLTLQSNFAYRFRSRPDPDSLLVDQGVLSGLIDLGWRAGRTGAGVAFNRGINRDAAQPGNDWHEDRFSARVDRQIGSRISTSLVMSRADRRLPNGAWTSRERRVEGRVGWARRERVWVSVARDRQIANVEEYERDQWEIGLGWEQPLLWNLELGVDGITAIGVGQREPETARWSVRLGRSLNFGEGRIDPTETVPEFGSIGGRVYDDANGNGHPDEGEPGIPNLVVKLGSGPEATTDARGEYHLSRAAIDLESVTLDVSRLPARYLAPRERRLVVSLRPGERTTRHFGVRQSAAVAGRVVRVGRDGRAAGVPGALVRVAGGHQDAFTDDGGRFLIPGLEPGAVTFRLEEWSLPEGARPIGSVTREIYLNAGAAATLEDFVVEQPETPVLQRFESSHR